MTWKDGMEREEEGSGGIYVYLWLICIVDDEPGQPGHNNEEVKTEEGSELEGTAQPPPPRQQLHPEPGGYSGLAGHYVMDNITMQNQFYETQVIKQENESGYERRPLEIDQQQQAYRPGRKAHVIHLFWRRCNLCAGGLYLLPTACLPRNFVSSF